MSNLVTDQEILEFLSVDSPIGPQLTILSKSISAAVIKHCGRRIAQETFTEYYDGNGKESLLLKEYPIVSVTSVTHYDINGNATSVVASDFNLYKEKGSLKLKAAAVHSSIWLRGDHNYKVIYAAGYNPIPEDIKLACLTWIATLWQKSEHKLHAVASKSFGDENTTYRVEKIPEEVAAMLEPYVRPSYA